MFEIEGFFGFYILEIREKEGEETNRKTKKMVGPKIATLALKRD